MADVPDLEEQRMLEEAIAMSLVPSTPPPKPSQPSKPALSQEDQDRLLAERLATQGSLPRSTYSSQPSDDLDAALAASLAYDGSVQRTPAGYLPYPGVGGGVQGGRSPYESGQIPPSQGSGPMQIADEEDEELQQAIRESMLDR